MRLATVFCLSSIVISIGVHAANNSKIAWPSMKEFGSSFSVDATADKIEFNAPLYTSTGMEKYLFVCHGGSDKYLDALSDKTGINYVGNLGCKLLPGLKETEESLLAEDDSPPWETRGQFHWSELVGDCGNYPEYGRLRHFSLRGFVLTLEAVDVKEDVQGKLQSFTMRVSLKNDPSATSERVAHSGYIYPKSGNCKQVVKGNEPRMCRDWKNGGSWAECKD